MTNITLQEMYDEWKKAANGIGTPSDSAQPDPTQAATIIATLKGQLERLGDLLEQMQGNGTGAMPVELTGRTVEEIIVLNASAITDASVKTTNEIDISKFRDFDIEIINTLEDATSSPIDIALGFRIGTPAVGVAKLDGNVLAYTASGGSGDCYNQVPSVPTTGRTTLLSMVPIRTSTGILTNSDVADLFPWRRIKGKFRMTYRAISPPLAGSVTIKIKGVPN